MAPFGGQAVSGVLCSAAANFMGCYVVTYGLLAGTPVRYTPPAKLTLTDYSVSI